MESVKYIKRVISAILVIGFVYAAVIFLDYAIYDDTYVYTRTMFNEFYKQDKIDVLLLGSSHCYRGIEPKALDEIMEVNSFNASSSSQVIDGSYYILLEAIKDGKCPNTVVLDLSYSSARQKIENEERDAEGYTLDGTFIISDYLKHPFNRFRYLTQATSENRYGLTFLQFRRKNIVEGLKSSPTVLERKHNESYINYHPLKYDDEEYTAKGFVANYHVASEEEYTKEAYYNKLDTKLIRKSWFKYLNGIIEVCKKNDIRLVIVNIPEPMYLINSYGNYDDYIRFVQEILADKDVEYYNFNLLQEDFFPDDISLFKDNNHLNYDGAKKFTTILAEVLENPDYFEDMAYSTSAEKLHALGYWR